MTDEEKAKQYAEDYKTKDGRSLDYCDIKQAYLDGLAEGRKDLEKVKTEKYFYKKDTQELEKENAELSNSVTELTNTKTELENKVTELEKQIEKMKNCTNCKYKNDSNTDYYCEDCKRFAYETDTDKWELAE